MQRVILVALGTVTFISGAAAINIGASATTEESLTRAQYNAALEQIAATRPLAQARCDRCLVGAHAIRGRALLEIAAPYQQRS